MSLVSCAIGKTLWNLRASDLEFEFSRIAEMLHEKMDAIRDIADSIADIDRRADRVEDNYRRAMALGRHVNTIARSRMEIDPSDPQYDNLLDEQRNKIIEQITQQEGFGNIGRMLGNAEKYRQAYRELKKMKMNFKGKERMLHEEEKVLQSKKNLLDTQLKMANAMGPSFDKMENNAVKRFTVKV